MSSVQQNVIKHKVGLLNLAAELGNVSRACKVMGFSRDTFYRYQSAGSFGTLQSTSLRKSEIPLHSDCEPPGD
jgi:ACT domain-containing protein